ncbi:myotubularin-related protein 14 isoform X1 [Thrips palmi]|uniref:Myotubularin-related protein 14 isoform X1 n=1 Tax=Thrips palmi TaxID=161013 RepID=A0A6P8ZMY3_THRPL|nr:myotubularin-related protein 14 isoform X1 [Thrips palmi]
MDDIKLQDINQLLEYFAKNTYKAKETDKQGQDIMQRCIDLISIDYDISVVSNSGGELSAHYPSSLIVLEKERIHTLNRQDVRLRQSDTIYESASESVTESTRLRDLISKARLARCRARFPLPVILYQGKHICRSATLSGGPEIYGRSGLDYLFSGSDTPKEPEEKESKQDEEVDERPPTSGDWQLFDRVRSQDIRLLKLFNVGTIVDLMLEKKKVKFGVNVTSSEKVDKENRYSEFTIVSLPYPGCEFFRQYRDNNYQAQDLVFDWGQAHVDASIVVPEDPFPSQLPIKWDRYKQWDLIKLTQNYMHLLLHYLSEQSSGLLVHCISGWDRTPLFVSLLRLSLWADGLAHRSLGPAQILYLTVAYDWLLFGHNLEDRLDKGEEIFFFCFYFLKHITSEEFSIGSRSRLRQSTDSEPHLDCLSLSGSNVSLNSWCSADNNPPAVFHLAGCDEGYPNQQWSSLVDSNPALGPTATPRSPHPSSSRTSPVAVPVPSRLRQRQESSGSSLSVGSWQLISGTGSLRGSASTASNSGSITPRSVHSHGSCNADMVDSQVSAESSCTLTEDDCFIHSKQPTAAEMRQDRLEKVRTLFYNAYFSTVGFNLKNSDSGLSSILGNFAEKVGIRTVQRSPV